MKSYVKTQLQRLRVFLIFDIYKRSKYIKKKNIFYSIGDNVLFQPRKIPSDPKLVKIGNNVVVASGVTFITHDICHLVLNNMCKSEKYKYYARPIEVGDNVYIGANVTILPNVHIGNNVIIGAGSIVTKDIEDNLVVAGNPIRKIKTFDEYLKKREETDKLVSWCYDFDKVWSRFNYEKHNIKN